MVETKIFQLNQLKLSTEDAGTFEAVFATLDAVDRDGDSYDPGAIGTQDVKISQWNHGSWQSGADALPIGVGRVYEQGNEGIIKGEFDMSDETARKHYKKIKYLLSKGHNVEWSFALENIGYRYEERDGNNVRIITSVTIQEVSPVLRGAGVNTRILAIKSDEMKSAIPSHSTATTDVAWDGPANVARAKNDQDYSYYSKIFAWAPHDPEDRKKKSKYKYPHHMVSQNGTPGAANMRGCSAGIAVLNGARGGASIPESDRKGIYRHLARHLKDGDKEVPELRSIDSLDIERNSDNIIDNRPTDQSTSKRLIDHINEVADACEKVTARIVDLKKERDETNGYISKRSMWHIQMLRDIFADSFKQIDNILIDLSELF
mgnify:CR=1 FL=1